MKIAVIGTGYVGLVVGTCFAESGNNVICVDIDEAKIKMLRKGKSPIFEPGLEELLKSNIHEKRISFTTNLEQTVKVSEVIFLALPTPPSEDGSADLKHVLSVAKQIGKYLNGYKIIVNKSTVPVGTADKVRDTIQRETKWEFDVVSNPEFLKEGAAVNDFMKPDRVVLGLRSVRARKIMEDLYEPFVRTGNPMIVMDERSSELTKYAANAMLATKISFMNEIANLCERVGANVDMIRRGIGTDARIGNQFLFSGIGYGGSCFPKDVSALSFTSKENDYDFKILNAVEDVNDKQKNVVVEKALKFFKGKIKGKQFAIWGLSFKPNTDDVREAPSLTVIKNLLKRGAILRVHDPVAMKEMKKHFGDSIKYFDNNYDTLKGVEALFILTEWNEFRRPDFDKMKKLMKRNVIFDGRNIYDSAIVAEKGFTYFSIGRGAVNAE
ncbi:MAG: UDP-glucose/GDP-mannose dehydrogenase family protein [Ignavibacteriales bacterium]|nr:UDP-glucose/GDP-mannose dehydrogenase family protein [Ignavibacteriales bacterium]